MEIVSLIKKLPIDVGQAEKKHNTAGKQIAFSLVRNGMGKTALDIGCRDGYWSERIATKGYKVKSLDREPHYKEAIKHNAEKRLPYQANSFDLVWCTEVIEHLNNPKFFLKEIERIIKKDGISILTTPNSNWWLYWIVKLFGYSPEKLQNKDHKQFFNEKDLRKLAHEYQFFGYFPYALFFLKIRCFIGFLSPTFIFYKKFK